MFIQALQQEAQGAWRRLRGASVLETSQMRLTADEVDYNEETAEAEARGHVRFVNFVSGETLEAERAEYNLETEMGRFYEVKGSSPAKVEAKPGILTTTSPFSFQGKWAERQKNRYILHDGFITNCRLPNAWWIIKGPTFDVIPNDRAIARNSVFRLRGVPIFYTPVFYKSLEELPRRSGFLTPSIGNSSRRGMMIGAGYYWAINRSYDLTYRGQYFTTRGPAHTMDFRGKPREGTDFDMVAYGVQDRGRVDDAGNVFKEGGYQLVFTARSQLGRGWEARAAVTYLNSFTFRQAFTDSFLGALDSQINSIGFARKQTGAHSYTFSLQRSENYQTSNDDSRITIRHLPQFDYHLRDTPVSQKVLPIWVSLGATAGAVRRSQPQFQSRQFVERLDLAPRASMALRWKDIHLIPSFSTRSTYYGSSLDLTQPSPLVTGKSFSRFSREVTADLLLPSLARVFDSPFPNRMGTRWKHVIEPRATFRHVSGVQDFQRLIRFDETELVNNTTEVEISLTNRLYSKQRNNNIDEILTWQLLQRRYFDPTFGGAVLPGKRNVILSSLDLTGFAFLDGPRRYSPVVSVLRTQPMWGLGVEWRTDYDPLRQRIINSSFTTDGRFRSYFFSAGHTQVRSSNLLGPDNRPVLALNSNQFRATGGFGQQSHRGWNAAVSLFYDYRERLLQNLDTHITYNSDCCGFSVQLRQVRRFTPDAPGGQLDPQVRFAFVIANIGSFGTLRQQERMF